MMQQWSSKVNSPPSIPFVRRRRWFGEATALLNPLAGFLIGRLRPLFIGPSLQRPNLKTANTFYCGGDSAAEVRVVGALRIVGEERMVMMVGVVEGLMVGVVVLIDMGGYSCCGRCRSSGDG